MIKLVAFDWNGTLLADTTMNIRCCNIVFKKFAMKPVNLLKFQKTFNIPASIFWQANGGKTSDLNEQAEDFHNLYLKKVHLTRTRAGSNSVLKWIQEHGIQNIIYSNHTTEDILNQIKRLKISGCFSAILARSLNTQGHVQVHKRHKEDYLKNYTKTHNLKPHEVISVGDTEEEIEIGKKYGYHTVAITGGYNTTARLKKCQPDFLIHNLKNLIPIIKKLNK